MGRGPSGGQLGTARAALPRGHEYDSVEVFEPLKVPGGGLFFDGPLHEDRGPLIRADPVLAHNNFLVGKEKKLERFRKHGMWYADFGGAFDDALLHRAPSGLLLYDRSNGDHARGPLHRRRLVCGRAAPFYISTRLAP